MTTTMPPTEGRAPAERVAVRHLLRAAGAPAEGPAELVVERGRIAAVRGLATPPEGPRRLAMPCLVNAHDHARPVRSSSFGAGGKPLEIWLHYLALLPSLDPYTATAASLARSARGGCGVVMIHHTRVQGLTDLPTEAAEMARAARDVGVRCGFAVALRDRNPLVYGLSEPVLAALPAETRALVAARLMRAPRSIEDQVALVDAVAEAAHADDFVVQYGPAGPQWCSDALLRAVARASERTGRRVHMHCLETRYQRDWADRTHPDGLMRHLDGLGLMTPRLTLAHCTHARPDELDLIAARGVTIAVNTSSNLGIRSGLAPVAEMIRRGCRVALGLDGLALDEDDDALREMRLTHLLHQGTGFVSTLARDDALAAAFASGRAAVLGRGEGGVIAEGEPADLLILDWDRVDDDHLRDDLDPLDLLFARAEASHVHALRVGGRLVVEDGAATGVDEVALTDALRDRIRRAMRAEDGFAAALRPLETALRQHAHPGGLCCQ